MNPVRRQCGFTLLEMSIVVAIIAIILAVGFSWGKGTIAMTTRTSTNKKLDQIEAALMAFRVANNRLPCPADATLLESNANYGVEGVSGGACTTGSTYNTTTGIRTVAANPGPTANVLDSVHQVVEGALPFKALNLPKEFMYDGWGRKFAYAVNYNVTAPLAMLGESLTDNCKIPVNDASGNPRTTGAIYTLISYGEDGHGGYLKTGARNNAGSTNVDELANCHCDSTATETAYSLNTPTSTPAGQPYVQHDRTEDPTTPTDLFDDFVRFKERWQMMTYDDQNSTATAVGVCTPGFRIDDTLQTETGGTQGSIQIIDVNGDGIPDLLISDRGGNLYVVYGTAKGFPNPLPLNSLNGTNGFTLQMSPWAGPSAFAVADIDGDGYPDIILQSCGLIYTNANGWNNECGLFILFGQAAAWPSTVKEISYNQSNGNQFSIKDGNNNVIAGARGTWVTSASETAHPLAITDVDKDGYPDIIMGDLSYGGSKCKNGQIYVIFGHANSDPWPTSTTFATLMDGTHGYSIGKDPTSPTNTDCFGQFIATGDVNGDGYGDIIAYDTYSNGNSVRFDVFFGHKMTKPVATHVDINSLGAGQISLLTNPYGAGWGPGINIITGDLNGDGIADIINSGNYASTGTTLVLFGQTNAFYGGSWPATIDLSTLNGTNGFYIHGTVAGNSYGRFNFVADINGDGIPDLVTSAGACSISSFGNAYVVYGHAAPWTASASEVSYADGTHGFVVNDPVAGDMTVPVDGNCETVGAGDINGDGHAELFLGAPNTTYGGKAYDGSIYVLYGKRNWPASTSLAPLQGY